MVSITIDDTRLQQRLKHIEEALGAARLARVLNDIGEQMVESIKQHITRNEDWSGQPFAPNTPTTLARKRGTQPLLDSGIFRRTRIFHTPGPHSVTIEAGGVQAAVLQFGAATGQFGTTKRGAPIPWGKIEPRRYMPITESGDLAPSAHAEILTIIEEHVDSLGK